MLQEPGGTELQGGKGLAWPPAPTQGEEGGRISSVQHLQWWSLLLTSNGGGAVTVALLEA